MDLYNRDDLREFLVSLYGEQAKRWEMTEKMFNLTHTLVRESGSCTSAMNFVPRPMPIGQTPYKYLSKQLRSAFLRHLNYNKEQLHILPQSCCLENGFRV